MSTTRAWHFTSDRLRDGRPIPAIGETLKHEGPVRICESGLHASERLTDALMYAPNLTLHAVYVADVVERHPDKLVARERTILATYHVDIRVVVRFAIECAALAFFAVGLEDDRLTAAAEHADRGDFEAALAAWAAADAANAARAAANAARAAADTAARAARAARAANAARAAARAANAAADAARAAWAAADAAADAANAADAADAARACVEARAIALFTGATT